MVTALARNSDAIRKQIQELTSWLRETRDKADKKIVTLAILVTKVQQQKLYKEWKDPHTKKFYKTFGGWMHAEIKESRANVYRFIGVREHLKNIPDKKLEEIGNTRCFELVKIARDKPSMLGRFIKAIEKKPDMPVITLRTMVANTLAGGGFDSGQYDSIEFVVKREDAPYVHKALAVMQAVDAVSNPETPSGRGVHLIGLCQEYLSGREQVSILKRLEEAGAFSHAAWKIEE
jgi:hypothetical protein